MHCACVRASLPLDSGSFLSAANILPTGPHGFSGVMITVTGCHRTFCTNSIKMNQNQNEPGPPPSSTSTTVPFHGSVCSMLPSVFASFGAEAAENRDDAAPCAQNAQPIFFLLVSSVESRPGPARPGSARLRSTRPERQTKQAAYVTPPPGNPPGLSGLDLLRCAGGRRGFRAPRAAKQRASGAARSGCRTSDGRQVDFPASPPARLTSAARRGCAPSGRGCDVQPLQASSCSGQECAGTLLASRCKFLQKLLSVLKTLIRLFFSLNANVG